MPQTVSMYPVSTVVCDEFVLSLLPFCVFVMLLANTLPSLLFVFVQFVSPVYYIIVLFHSFVQLPEYHSCFIMIPFHKVATCLINY